MAPEEAVNLPLAQLEQALNPVDAAKVPARQVEHAVAETAEYFPVAQTPVTAESPVVAQYDPAVHALHTLSPAVAAKVPVEQLAQEEEEAVEL